MHCKHCRVADLPKKIIYKKRKVKIIDFINQIKSKDIRINISEGEPFLNPELIECLSMLIENDIDNCVITINASLVKDDILKKLEGLDLSYLCL